MTEETTQKCLNCEADLKGKFCHACGQKVIEDSERTFKHLVFQFFGSAFFLENNFLKNLWNLVARPGRLPLDFIEGRRKRWMPPFSLFLLINLFYFWYSPLSDLNLSLSEQMGQPHHGRLAQHLVNKKIKSESISFDEYAERYAQKSSGYANSLIVLQIPIFAFFLMLLFYKKRYFFIDHFMVSLYYFAFFLLAALVIYRPFAFFPNSKNYWIYLNILFDTAIMAYMAISIRVAYKSKWWASALLSVPAIMCFLLTHFIYRTILFLIIYSVT